MIDYYEFDNANVDGDKEAVIIPNPPTLVNKLSAAETNGMKDKINEIVDAVNPMTPISFLELRLKFKGNGNTLSTLQVGDIVHGFADADTIWTNAVYNGGDVNDRENYTEVEVPVTQFIASGSDDTYDTETITKIKAVFWNGALLNDNDWTQTGTEFTLTFTPASGDIIKPI